ncbi:uncharacterized protein N7496_009021 [Penicillium cataractarum]|uniref:F-box domain-containing protein n=1 Tax=Penicillium cataractarum TaxID=2100454 RepID=A0A9W9RZS2_9EURO|nr:uncharacterized protein N7496_009021 [Penicillium cataractarum]KAJ5369261.1 hypothetical protein N7496_009021 [Penicillium cataractarum]
MAQVGPENLPPEVMYMILGYLGVPTWWQPSSGPQFCLSKSHEKPDQPVWYSVQRNLLRNLCLVCREWRRLVEPILYQEFMPGHGGSWRSDSYTWDRRLTSYLLADLSIERPERAKWAAARAREVPTPRPEPITWREAKDTLREIARALESDDLRTLSPSDLLAGLMAELPHLEHLSLQIGGAGSMLGAKGLRAAEVSRLPLKTIDICYAASKYVVECAMLLPLDEYVSDLWEACPSLETLNLHMCTSLWNRLTPFPPLPKLTTLRLTHSCQSKSNLEHILSASQGLRHFYYESTTRGHFIPGDPLTHDKAVQLGDAVELLKRHRATLETLHLDRRRESIFPGSLDLGPVVRFQNFPALYHLFLSMDEIHLRIEGRDTKEDPELWIQILPPNIKSLHLASTILDARCLGEESLIRGQARAISRGPFSSLREVRWGARQKNQGECQFPVCPFQPLLPHTYKDRHIKVKELSSQSAIEAMFAAAGVDFGVAVWPGSLVTFSDASKFHLGYFNVATNDNYPPQPLPDEDEDLW